MKDDYEADFLRITHTGPHLICDELRSKNRLLYKRLADIVPLQDALKINDCDLIYRFLVARKCDVDVAERSVRDYISWRQRERIDLIFEEKFPEDLLAAQSKLLGVDKEGYPVMYNTPDPTTLASLLKKYPLVLLMRGNIMMIEKARSGCLQHRVDRVTWVVDLSLMTLRSLTVAASSFLKAMSRHTQEVYPELMRRMLICNGGWVITAIYKFVRPLLDVRVQQKLAFVNGPPCLGVLREVVEEAQIPLQYGGTYSLQTENTTPQLQAPSPTSCAESVSSCDAVAISLQLHESDDGFYSIASSEDEPQHDTALELGDSAGGQIARETISVSLRNHFFHGKPEEAVHPTSVLTRVVVQLVVQRDGTSITVLHGEEVVCFKNGCNAFRNAAPGAALVGEAVKESGHPMHLHLIIADARRRVRFILKKRLVHQQVDIFETTGNHVLVTSAGAEHKAMGEKVHTMTAAPRQQSNDIREWGIYKKFSKKRSQKEATCLAMKNGSVVTFYSDLAQEDLPMLGLLTASLVEQWHNQ